MLQRKYIAGALGSLLFYNNSLHTKIFFFFFFFFVSVYVAKEENVFMCKKLGTGFLDELETMN